MFELSDVSNNTFFIWEPNLYPFCSLLVLRMSQKSSLSYDPVASKYQSCFDHDIDVDGF